MAASLINIGQSGAAAARSSLEVTAQNIANAQTEGYVRRRLDQQEVSSRGTVGDFTSGTFNGVRIGGVYRPDTPLLLAQMRSSNSSLSQASAELDALKTSELSLEQSGLYEALVEFEASFAQLESDPLDASLRSNTLEQGRNLAGTFQLAHSSLQEGGDFLRQDAQNTLGEINQLAQDLAKLNNSLTRSEPNTGGHAVLLDSRDNLLKELSGRIGITPSFTPLGVVNVELSGGSGGALVTGTNAGTMTASANGDGTLAFALDGASVSPASGRIAGQASALSAQAGLLSDLDALAASTISILNTAQASGSAPDGSTGQPFFSGTGAGDIGIALADGSGIATAPAGAGANSLNTGNLASLRSALANGGPAAQADSILFELSSTVRNRDTARAALETIAQSAQSSLSAATEVDLDEEAANLIRFQQSFQASGRVIQVANELFDTILGIR